MVAANRGSRRVDAQLRVDTGRLGLGSGPRLQDPEHPERSPELDGARVRLAIPAADFRLLLLTRR